MTKSALKKELHRRIDALNDERLLEAIYTILDQQPVLNRYKLSNEQLEELDKRIDAHEAGKETYYTTAQMKRKVLAKRKR